MIVPVPTEVIPVWFIEKWKKENAKSGSPLEFFIERLIKDWNIEEVEIKVRCKKLEASAEKN